MLRAELAEVLTHGTMWLHRYFPRRNIMNLNFTEVDFTFRGR